MSWRNLTRKYGFSLPAIASLSFLYPSIDSNKSEKVLCSPQMPKCCSFGAGTLGQLGLGTQKDIFKPSFIHFFKDINVVPSKIACFSNKSLVLTQNGEVFMFGTGFVTSDLYNTVPVEVELEEKAKQISVGTSHAAVLSVTGSLYTWGDGYFGQLGIDRSKLNSDHGALEPTKVEGTFKTVACGNQFTCGIDSQGRAFTWGNGRDGALGHGTTSHVYLPQEVDYFTKKNIKLADVACGQDFSIFLSEDGSVYSCGSNDYGQLGTGPSNVRKQSTPKRVQSLRGEKIVKIAAGDYHVAALSETGKLYMFGLGKDGQLGENSRNSVFLPTLVEGLEGIEIKEISCGGGHSGIVDTKGNLFLWGRGRNGQLGIGEQLGSVAAYKTVPTLVQGLENVVELSCGADHTIVLCQ